MWGDEIDDGDDLLDRHSRSAYKYATTQLFSVVATKTGGGLKSKGGDAKKQKKLVKSQSVIPQKSSSKGKLKGSKRGGLGSSIRGSGKTAKRRVHTSNNDADYYQLDGTASPSLNILTPFDHTALTQVELFHSGIQAAIPSEQKHKKTWIERLLPPSAIAEAGVDFKKKTDLRGSVSRDEKQQTTTKQPEWIDLRNNYMKQLDSSIEKITKIMGAPIKEYGTEVNEVDVSIQRHFILLLVAVRKVTVRIISEYTFQANEFHRHPDNEYAASNLLIIKKYLTKVPNCFKKINCQPYISWVGICTEMNPLLLSHKLDGVPAYQSDTQTIDLNPLLEMEGNEWDKCLSMSAILWDIFQDSKTLPARPLYRFLKSKSTSKSNNQDNSSDDDADDDDNDNVLESDVNSDHQSPSFGLNDPDREEDSDNDTDAYLYMEDNHLKLIIEETKRGIDNALEKSRDLKVFTMGLKPIQTYWIYWKRAYANNLRIDDAINTRNDRNRRICFDRLVHNVWQSIKFRSLQENYSRRIIVVTFNAWTEYKNWCKKFQNLYGRSVMHIKRLFMNAMKRFAKDVIEVRTFRKKNRLRTFALAFDGLKRNTTLSKFELTKRLEHKTTATFKDRYMFQRIFSRWKKRNKLIVELDFLEDFVEKIDLKNALVRWVLLTYGPRSTRRARSIAKAMNYVSQMRESFEKTASSSFRYISDSVSSISPLMSSEDRKKLDQERFRNAEKKRRYEY